MNRNKLTGGIFVFLGACSFGVLSTIVKNAYEKGYTLGQITGSQVFVGMVILWICFFLHRSFTKGKNVVSDNNSSGLTPHNGEKVQRLPEGKNSSFPRTALWKVAFAGVFTGLVGIFYYQCVKLLPASIAIILLMQYLWISILIEAIVFRKKPHKIQLIAASIVLIGTVFAAGIFNETVTLNIQGIGFGLLAAFCYAIFLIASGRVGNDLPVLKKGALMITGSCMATWLIFPPLYLFDGLFFDELYKWGFILALLGTVIPPLFFSFGIPRTGVSLGAILSAAELPVAVVSSGFILQENVQALQWVGVFLILCAILLTNIKFSRTAMNV